MHLPSRRIQRFLAYGTCVLLISIAFSTVATSIETSTATAGTDIPSQDAIPTLYDETSYQGQDINREYMALDSFSILDHIFRICIYIFLSAVFAGLTLGVMTIDTFTLEIIAESGRMPDCKFAEQILPLRKDAHKTLCTLIISNMLCNVLVVQQFRAIVSGIRHPDPVARPGHVVDDFWADLWEFAGSTFLVVVTEILPMSICKSKYSLRVAAWGAIFVHFAMILTYPVSMPLGKFLDWVVGGKERGQIYDRNELRRLMVIQYERKGSNKAGMSKSELDLLLSAMDFQESKVRDVMRPIDGITHIHESDLITPDFIAHIWLSGRSRVPVMSEKGTFDSVLVVKDLLTVDVDPSSRPTKVAQIIKEKKRGLAMVESSTTLPRMLRIFQDLKTHMALVFSADGCPGAERAALSPSAASTSVEHVHTVIGLVTMEDVVEKLLNEEIYDEYDRYGAVDGGGVEFQDATVQDIDTLSAPTIPEKHPRVNFYSYFTHPEADVALTVEQVWALAFFLQRTISCFSIWNVEYIKRLLDDCHDQQLVPPSYMQRKNALLPSTIEEDSLHGSRVPSHATKSPNDSSLSDDRKDSTSTNNLFPYSTTHSQFLSMVEDEKFILYKKGVCSTNFTIVLGGQVELLVGEETFSTRIFSFSHVGEEALISSVFIPNFSAIVLQPARVYCIPRELYIEYASHQLTKPAMVRSTSAELPRPRGHFNTSFHFSPHPCSQVSKKNSYAPLPSGSFRDDNLISDQKAYGTFNK
ncbi:unnamed protein product [Phytomonas sp. EM1]|nr:unnamed protein product [Phytomonas sp. EM1]|eukprot:CCW61278.1 unnamed protein product [Phytomonas sp. isolate EM1]